jgi:hypothetical protein
MLFGRRGAAVGLKVSQQLDRGEVGANPADRAGRSQVRLAGRAE